MAKRRRRRRNPEGSQIIMLAALGGAGVGVYLGEQGKLPSNLQTIYNQIKGTVTPLLPSGT